MTTRMKKLVAAVPRTTEEMEALVQSTVTAQLQREKLVAERDEIIQRTAGTHNTQIAELDTALARNLELLEAWAEAHRDAFGRDKSIAVHGHRLGWKLGNWKTETLKKWKWAEVLEALKEAGKKAERFIRTKEEPDKQAMIAEREEAADLLRSCGVAVVQEETFFLAPDREGQEPSLMTV